MYGMSLRRIASPLAHVALALLSTATMVAQQAGAIIG